MASSNLFFLPEKFISPYRKLPDPFGFDGLGKIVFARTYARPISDGSQETWTDTVRRVVEGTYRIQQRWIEQHKLGWNKDQALRSAQEMFDRMWHMKFLPPGRGLWAMGSKITEDKQLFAALSNCGFVSTEDIDILPDPSLPFCFLMDMSMLGVGVGFDTKGAGKIKVQNAPVDTLQWDIQDTREGWVDSVGQLVRAYLVGIPQPKFDYSLIRPAGQPLKTFGGISAGAEPLRQCHEHLRKILDANIGKPLSSTLITDICNIIAKCVMSGNVRRSALIALGESDDTDFLNLKNYTINPHRAEYGWTSNNSILASTGSNYNSIADTIQQNGEPGVIWLSNIREYGRMADGKNYSDSRAVGVNPCSEQSLESFELCCVSGETRITTEDHGSPKIKDVVGKKIKVWNGETWSETIPFLAGKDKILYRVTLSDGSILDCTEDHEWSAKPKTARKFRKIRTSELQPTDLLETTEVAVPDTGIPIDAAYEWGLFAGDGYITNDVPMVVVCGQKSKLKQMNVLGKWYKEQIKPGYTDPVNRLNIKNYIPLSLAKELNDKTKGIPDLIFYLDTNSLKEFLAGYIDSDGSLTQQVSTDNFRIFGVEEKMRDLQILLRRIGINFSSIHKIADAGDTTNFGIRNYALWYCYIPSFECTNIPTRIKIAKRFGDRNGINNAHSNSKKIDRARKQHVVSIVKLPGKHTTYCFNEPLKHKGLFNNVLTHQCLVETFPTRADDLKDYLRTLKFAYLYAKTVTLCNTHWEQTNRVLLRNRRIGCSMSGIQQFVAANNIDTLIQWCDEGYKTIRSWDKIYSDWLAIPQSIKVTSIKPSGSVSLLAGATPGMHWPVASYYLRRLRVGNNDPLLPVLSKAGFSVEPCVGSEETTSVVSFPVCVGEGVRSASDVSMWEQLAFAALLQRHWADNQVSCTVSFDPEVEGPAIEQALDLMQYQLKAISFLPRHEDAPYPQMPYEPITKEQYEIAITALNQKKLDSKKLVVDHVEEKFCDGDTCQI